MNNIDHRIHYIMMMDTETANTLTRADGSLDMTSVFVYDIGWQVTDKRGTVYEQKSYIVKEIFFGEKQLMQSAYYAKKIPQYVEDLQNGKRIMANTYEIRKAICQIIKHYDIQIVCAHNARFDYNSLNNTQRWTTKSKYRYFLPYGLEWWDTLKMARSVMGKMPTYKKFCEQNGYTTKTGKPRFTAEICYRFITKDLQFRESHTGLEDVEIEAEILEYCHRQHKAMKKKLWGN